MFTSVFSLVSPVRAGNVRRATERRLSAKPAWRARFIAALAIAALLSALVSACGNDTPVDPCKLPPASKVSLPADDSGHNEAIEWWYWTGHLVDDANRWYGYQVTFFIFGGVLFLSNVALTDIDGKTFYRDAEFSTKAPKPIADSFDFSMGVATAAGGNGTDTLTATMVDASFDLNLAIEKPAIVHHGDGYHEYSFGGYTYYYSRTRMKTTGTVTIAGEQRQISGLSWFDHQWGDLSDISAMGWDWFAIQLDDGRDLMLFFVHGTGGNELVGGTIVDATCGATELPPEAVKATAIGSWTSPNSGCTYPMGWNVEAGGMALTVTQVLDDQEHYNARDVTRSYWEGAALVSGDAAGRAYVELTGYCQ